MSLRDQYNNLAHDATLRAASLRANAQFQVGTVVTGGERHLVDFGNGAIASNNFGGATAIGDPVLNRNDGGKGWFYSNN